MIPPRHLRVRVLEALELRSKQFRTREDIWPFRVPHDPLALDAIVQEALADDGGRFEAEGLRARTVLRLSWHGGGMWEAWVVTLPSGLHLYCDTDGEETRVLASVKRGAAAEADRMFLELLAQSRGMHFGIELTGDAPDRIRTSIVDRGFLVDFFVELFEGSAAEPSIRDAAADVTLPLDSSDVLGSDFRSDVDRWLTTAYRAP
jgi:hypothetical protein